MRRSLRGSRRRNTWMVLLMGISVIVCGDMIGCEVVMSGPGKMVRAEEEDDKPIIIFG